MVDYSQDPKVGSDSKADVDPNHTVEEDIDATVAGSQKDSTKKESVNQILDTIVTMLETGQQDLHNTLPLTTLRPKDFPTTADPTSSVSVQPRIIRSATDTAASQLSDDSSSSGNGPDYVTLELLGEGGMGTVHLARQVALGRAVAVKQIQMEHRQRPSIQREFLVEAVLTGRLEHPNIVPVYEVGRSPEGDLFYSMKNIKGQPWSNTIGTLSLDKNLEILINVCDAIAFAHAEGVIHRDIKPQNIMTGGFGEVLVLDWGLALAVGAKTYVNSFAGTPAFLAPEMVNPPFDVGTHSDIYLLGATLFMLLTGKPPHAGASARDCLLAAAKNKIIKPNEDRIRELDPSGELLGMAMRAMATNPEERYSTVAEFQQAIRDFTSHRESLVLSSHAEESLAAAQSTGDYEQYSRAAFGFEEAFKLWDGNVQAKEGFISARLVWALCAEEQGDFDLALSLLDESVSEQQEIRARVIAARRQRDAHRGHVRRLRLLSLAAGVLILIGAIGFGIYQQRVTQALASQRNKLANQRDTISQQYDNIKIEQEKARQALRAESEAKELEAAQRAEAQQQRENAERQSYLNHIHSAQREWDTNYVVAAWPHLDECPDELRGWEYRYLHTLFTRNNETFKGHNGWVVSVAFSPDGNRIVSAGSDKTLKLWNADTGQEVLSFAGHAGAVSSVAFSTDGSRIVSGSFDNTLKLWDAGTGEETLTLEGHTGAITCVAFSPNGKLIASSGGDTLKLWEAATGEETATMKGHANAVTSLAFNPVGSHIVSGSYDHTLKLWDVSTGKETLTLQGHTETVYAVAFSLDGRRIASGSSDKTLKLWDAATGNETATIKQHTDSIYAVAFSPDSKRVLSGSSDRTVKLWDIGTREETLTLKGHTDAVTSVAFSPDGSRVISSSRDQSLKLWNIGIGKETLTFRGHADRVTSVTCTPDGKRIVSGSDDNTLKLRDADTGEETLTLKGHTGSVNAVAVSPDVSRIASGSSDKTLKLWNTETGAETATFKGHTDAVYAVAFSPDGRRIASGSPDNTLKLWDVETGEETLTLMSHDGSVTSVAFSPDGSRIVSGCGDTVKLWDPVTGEQTLTLEGHAGNVVAVQFSPDGNYVVSGSSDKTLKVWDIVNGEETLTLEGHTGSVTSVAFSRDGSRIVSGSNDNTLKLWDAGTGNETLTLKGHNRKVDAVAFHPDGSRIISGGSDNTLKLWDASGETPFGRWQNAVAVTQGNQSASNAYRASLGEKTDDWYAAAFHLGWLLTVNADDTSLQIRHANAESNLRDRRLAIPMRPNKLAIKHAIKRSRPIEPTPPRPTPPSPTPPRPTKLPNPTKLPSTTKATPLADDTTKTAPFAWQGERVELVWIPPGEFVMGSRSDGTRQVQLTRGFYLAKHEVTQKVFTEVMSDNPSFHKSNPSAPVENVTWDKAMAFCNRLTEIEHASNNLPLDFRFALPTEAQWEYACRAGTDDETAGKQLPDIAWYEKDDGPRGVGQKAPNPWGLYDMIGNVSEWCLDIYGPYQGAQAVDPVGASQGGDRVIRGASYFSGRSKCKASFRESAPASRGFSSRQTGFRVAVVKI